MMQLLTEKDYDAIIAYTKTNPYINLFIIGNLLQYGFDNKVQSFYGRYDNGQLVNILLRYRDQSLHLYADDLNDADYQTIQILLEKGRYHDFNLGSHTAPKVMPFLEKKNFAFTTTQLAVYQADGLQRLPYNKDIKIEYATAEDAVKIVELLSLLFDNYSISREIVAEELAMNRRITYVIRQGNKIVCLANAVAFSNDAAMIIGVGTLAKFCGKGYASSIVGTLCADLWQRGQRAVLFYDNPRAASIYQKIGFVDQEQYFRGKRKA